MDNNILRLGIDIGGTNIKFIVIDSRKVLYKNSIKTADICEKIIDDICNEVFKLSKQYNIKNIGIGTPGFITDGYITAANLPFNKTPLADIIAERTKMNIKLDNDANCAALGEIMFGTTTDCQNIVLLTLGTGVGGGIIMNRQICSNNNNMGELGHMIIQAENGKECPCGQKGCLEQYCSMTALISSAKAAALKNKESLLYDLFIKNNGLDGKLVFEAINNNCPVANAVYDEFLSYLARGIESIVNIFGPDAIVLAGGVTNQGDRLLKPLLEKIARTVRLEISTLQSDAGALGAAML